MAQFGLRLGCQDGCDHYAQADQAAAGAARARRPGVVVTRGSTLDNAANLAPPFLQAIKKRYEGTRLGRQELHAELLGDTPGALWRLDQIDAGGLEATGPGLAFSESSARLIQPCRTMQVPMKLA